MLTGHLDSRSAGSAAVTVPFTGQPDAAGSAVLCRMGQPDAAGASAMGWARGAHGRGEATAAQVCSQAHCILKVAHNLRA